MKMEPIYPDWTWEWINDWSGLWNRFNWYSFHILHVYGEAEYTIGKHYEFSFAVLGLGFEVTYTKLNEESQKLWQQMHDAMDVELDKALKEELEGTKSNDSSI